MIEIKDGFPEWAWPLAWNWIENRLGQIADDFFPRTAGEFVEMNSSRYQRTFGIWKDGSLSGAIAFERTSPLVMTAHILLAKRLWGIPAEDLRKAAALLFELEPDVIRIQAFVPAWNRLAVALTKRIGAEQEGIMRAVTLRSGVPADAVVFGLTKEHFNGIQPGRIVQFVELEVGLDVERESTEHVLRTANVTAGAVGEEPLERSHREGSGDALAGGDSAKDAGSGPDQHELDRADGPNAKVPVSARVRKKRPVRKSAVAERTRKAVGSRK